MKRLFLTALLGLGAGWCARAQRLPDTVAPESYDLTFTPDLTKARFAGSETIYVKLSKPAASVRLNAAELHFHEASIPAGGAPQAAEFTLNAEKETANASGWGRTCSL